jgi:hypothetical protein
MINSIHHFEIFTNASRKLLNYFTKGLNFELIAKKSLFDSKIEQSIIQSNNAYFIITNLMGHDLNQLTYKYSKTFEDDHFRLSRYLNQGESESA